MGVAVGRNQPKVFSFMGNVYLIRLYNDKESFFKIGITVHRYCRFYEIMKSGYKVDIVCMFMGIEYLKALYLESSLKSIFNPYLPKIKFGGYTECFKSVDITSFKNEFQSVEYNEVVENLSISWR